jgi:hypothetical protein
MAVQHKTRQQIHTKGFAKIPLVVGKEMMMIRPVVAIDEGRCDNFE